ncbi:hypothetical protein [Kocuria atrinae]|uniref:hypothetical protein n=1 Tax=Kocuria atrinae TaxID=592377 RepID=UPI0002D6BEA1|nr:hypothetical protein [Kocuria atrinae]
MLLIMHGLNMGMWGDSVAFLYDGGQIPSDSQITVQEEELLSYRWVAPQDLETVLSAGMSQRIRDAWRPWNRHRAEHVIDGGKRS